jgi:hypothetical protein
MATRKYRRGVECLMRTGIRRPGIISYVAGDSRRLFKVLALLGFRWNSQTGDWVQKER